MNEIYRLVKPRLYSAKNRIIRDGVRGRGFKACFLAGLGLAFWGLIFIIFYRVLSYFKRVEGFGDILALKLLSMVFFTFFVILIMSSLINLVAKLYLSRDLGLVFALPVKPEKVFLARGLEAAFDSSWMVIAFSLPVFLSYGIIFAGGGIFYLVAGASLIFLALSATGVSAVIVLLAALLLPAARLRTVTVFLGVLLFVFLILSLRLLKPEQLVNPESFLTVIQYLEALQTSGNALLPTTWAYDALQAALPGGRGDWYFHFGLLLSFVGTLGFLSFWIARPAYFPGFSRAQNAGRPPVFRRSKSRWAFFLSGAPRALLLKEIKTFFRDQTQWPQLILIAALVAVYVYNFAVLPLGTVPWRGTYLKNMVSFLNLGLSAFVLISLAARFVYPAVSAEGEGFWLIRAAPIKIETYLLVKFLVYLLPLLLLAEILVIATNLILEVSDFMMVLSVGTIFLIVPGIVSLALGLGAARPDFQTENPAQTATSVGGLIYMLLSALFVTIVVVLEAGGAYLVFMAELKGEELTLRHWGWLTGSFLPVAALSVVAIVYPFRYGKRRLGELMKNR